MRLDQVPIGGLKKKKNLNKLQQEVLWSRGGKI